MWSVVHLPAALINSRMPIKFSPSQGVKGRQQLQTLAVILDHHLDAAAVFRRGQVTSILNFEALFWQLEARSGQAT